MSEESQQLTNQQNLVSEDNRTHELKQVYKLAINTRNFEITNLIARNNFYMLFQGVLLAAALASEASKPYVELIICCCGLYVSWSQMRASSGAKYWQEYWEIKVNDIEILLSDQLNLTSSNKGNFIRLFQKNDTESHDKVKKELEHKNEKASNILKKISALIPKNINDLILRKYSVSKEPIYTAIALAITWCCLLLHTIDYHYIEIPFSLFDGFYFVNPSK